VNIASAPSGVCSGEVGFVDHYSMIALYAYLRFWIVT
jgi:hypothetical protein